jgi:hypothetical protein
LEELEELNSTLTDLNKKKDIFKERVKQVKINKKFPFLSEKHKNNITEFLKKEYVNLLLFLLFIKNINELFKIVVQKKFFYMNFYFL